MLDPLIAYKLARTFRSSKRSRNTTLSPITTFTLADMKNSPKKKPTFLPMMLITTTLDSFTIKQVPIEIKNSLESSEDALLINPKKHEANIQQELNKIRSRRLSIGYVKIEFAIINARVIPKNKPSPKLEKNRL